MAAPYDNIPGIDSTDNFHPDIRAALLASTEFNALRTGFGRLGDYALNTVDWNLAKTNGWYYSTPTAINGPAAVYVVGEVVSAPLAGAPGYYTQTVWEYASDSASNTKGWRRDGVNDVWQAWFPILMSQTELDARYQALITAGTTAQYYRGDKTWQTLNSTAVGLGNVNNTSDANKPVSTAQAAANDLLAKGLVYKAMVATSSGSIVDAICNNIPSFTFKANRNYRIVWDFSYYATGNSDGLFYCVIGLTPTADAAASTANFTSLEGRTKGLITSYALQSTQHTGPVTAFYNPGATDQTHQVKFRPIRVVGDDGIIITGNGNERAFYFIYDDGLQI